MGLMPLVALIGILGCLIFSAFFAIAETSLFSLNKWQSRQLQENSGSSGKNVSLLLAQPQDLLATIVMGNSFANAGMVVAGIWMALSGHWSVAIAVVAVLLVTVLGGEVIPKTLAVRAPEKWALRIARPMLWFQNASRPFRQIAQTLVSWILKLIVPGSIKPQASISEEEYQELL